MLASKLDVVEERLAQEVREGGTEVLKQLSLIHGTLLPELQSIIAQQTLELSTNKRKQSDGGGWLDWLWSSADEEQQVVQETQQCVKFAIEAADAKMKAAGGHVNTSASAEILQKLSEMHMQGSNIAPGSSDELLSKLSEMSSYLEQMDSRLTELRMESDENAKQQVSVAQANFNPSSLDPSHSSSDAGAAVESRPN